MMTVDDRVNAIYQWLKEEIAREAEDVFRANDNPNGMPSTNTLANFNNLVLTLCNEAKTKITGEWTSILRGGKSLPKELGMLEEFERAMTSLAELGQLKNEVSMKLQKTQEAWNKRRIHDPNAVPPPNLKEVLTDVYAEREGGSDYES